MPTRLDLSRKELLLVMPLGAFHGWGVCGRNLLRELARRRPVHHWWPGDTAWDGVDDLERVFLGSLGLPPEQQEVLCGDNSDRGRGDTVEVPVLQSIRDHSMIPGGPYVRGSRTIGYTFFERDTLPDSARDVAEKHYDLVVAGSSWCQEILERHGFSNTATVIQGVDRQLFNPMVSEKQLFQDRFVVFSGGKLSLRKGHDLVIRAIKVLLDRHADVLFVNAWFNPWPATIQGLAGSPHIQFCLQGEDHGEVTQNLLVANGIDLTRTVTLPARANALMAKIYKNTDVGVFPNRCEGGTNLVLMEFMACGKAVIASNSSGHRDILTADNSRRIETLGVAEIHRESEPVTRWDEPDLEELISHLEWAYQHRGELPAMGKQAATDLAAMTWEKSAAAFLELL